MHFHNWSTQAPLCNVVPITDSSHRYEVIWLPASWKPRYRTHHHVGVQKYRVQSECSSSKSQPRLPQSLHLTLLQTILQYTLICHITRTETEIENWSSLSKSNLTLLAAYRKEAEMNVASITVYSKIHLKRFPTSIPLSELLLWNQFVPILSLYLLNSPATSAAQFYLS